MNKDKKIEFLIQYLIKEDSKFENIDIHKGYDEKRKLLRSLMNVREPKEISDEFIKIQDEFLTEESVEKGIVNVYDLETIENKIIGTNNKFKDKIVLWKGDITTLEVDAIVNAANKEMIGCFVPCHRCIDNAIHSSAGIQLRNDCYEIMKAQKHLEVTGDAKLTKAYNLPAKHVIHTVGPIFYDKLNKKLCEELRSCYKVWLELADKNKLESIAFCCISTGEFRFPKDKAAKIAINEVNEYLESENKNIKKVILNVYEERDYEIYEKLLR